MITGSFTTGPNTGYDVGLINQLRDKEQAGKLALSAQEIAGRAAQAENTALLQNKGQLEAGAQQGQFGLQNIALQGQNQLQNTGLTGQNTLQNTRLSGLNTLQNTELLLGSAPPVASTSPEWMKNLGLANGGVVARVRGLIPGKVNPAVADDTTINAKKGEYVVPEEVVSALGADKFDALVKKVRESMGMSHQTGAKDPGMPDHMGRMDAPGMADGGIIRFRPTNKEVISQTAAPDPGAVDMGAIRSSFEQAAKNVNIAKDRAYELAKMDAMTAAAKEVRGAATDTGLLNLQAVQAEGIRNTIANSMSKEEQMTLAAENRKAEMAQRAESALLEKSAGTADPLATYEALKAGQRGEGRLTIPAQSGKLFGSETLGRALGRKKSSAVTTFVPTTEITATQQFIDDNPTATAQDVARYRKLKFGTK